MPLLSFERRFLWMSSVGLPLLALALGLFRGWRGALAGLLTALLVAADFLWMARGLRAVADPGAGVARGALPRAAGALRGRSLLLLLGLYGILRVLPGEGLAAAMGIGAPLALLAAAGLPGTRTGTRS